MQFVFVGKPDLGLTQRERQILGLIAPGTFLVRLLVGTVLLVAGLAKLKSPSQQFLQAILGYDLIPKPAAVVLATGLPWLEIMLGGLLLVGLWSRSVSLVSIGLLLIFSSGIALNLLRGKRNACGCFQSLTPVQWRLIYRMKIQALCLLIPFMPIIALAATSGLHATRGMLFVPV